MIKLTPTLRLARGQRRGVVAPARLALPTSAPRAASPRALTCSWTRDPATGQLECTWSSLSPLDRSTVRRPRHALHQPWTQLRLAA
jgi:hypothetical protein